MDYYCPTCGQWADEVDIYCSECRESHVEITNNCCYWHNLELRERGETPTPTEPEEPTTYIYCPNRNCWNHTRPLTEETVFPPGEDHCESCGFCSGCRERCEDWDEDYCGTCSPHEHCEDCNFCITSYLERCSSCQEEYDNENNTEYFTPMNTALYMENCPSCNSSFGRCMCVQYI